MEPQYYIYTPKQLEYLKQQDPRLRVLIEAVGPIKRPVNPDLYGALVDTIIGQQISTAAHQTIRARLLQLVQTVTPKAIFALADEELQQIGISWRKVGYIKSFTQKILSGEFNLQALRERRINQRRI